MTERKPRVDQLVPTYVIDRKLGRVHVATPDSEIEAMISEAIDKQTDPRWTPAIRRQTLRYALWRHHRNFSNYVSVMRGQTIR